MRLHDRYGIDIPGQRPRHLDTLAGRAFARTAADTDTRIRHLLPVLSHLQGKEVEP